MNDIFGFPARVVLGVAVCRLIWWSNATTHFHPTDSSGCYSINPHYSSHQVKSTLQMARDFTLFELTDYHHNYPSRFSFIVDAVADLLVLGDIPPTKDPHILMKYITTLRRNSLSA